MDTMVLKHVCKFCKKSFPCGRSLGGHIRSHLINNMNNPDDEPELSKPGFRSGYELRENPKKTNKAVGMLNSPLSSWSTGSETETEPDSDPTQIHQKQIPSTKSNLLGGNNSHSSVSEVVEPEQEEVAVAMCLIKLSKDVGNWGDVSSFSCQFSDHISLLKAKDTKKRNKKSKHLEFSACRYLENGSEMKEFEVSHNKRKVGDAKNVSKMRGFEVSEDGFCLNEQKINDHEFGFEESAMFSELLGNKSTSSTKRSKFECTTCNKVFHSYQALGGHRASHKKLVSKLETITNGKELQPSTQSANDQDQKHAINDIVIGASSSISSKKVVQKHECPICLRVFPSGQALGGHKRSHILAANKNINGDNNHLVENFSSPKIRDLLDLNLPPASAEEETNAITNVSNSSSCTNSLVGLIKPYWWVESSKHETMLGLIFN